MEDENLMVTIQFQFHFKVISNLFINKAFDNGVLGNNVIIWINSITVDSVLKG